MAEFLKALEETYPDNEVLRTEISSLKRKLDIQDKENVEEDVKKQKMDFKCDQCDKTFHDKRHLIRHALSHRAYFGCTLCSKTFSRRDNLKRHLHKKHKLLDRNIPASMLNEVKKSQNVESNSTTDDDRSNLHPVHHPVQPSTNPVQPSTNPMSSGSNTINTTHSRQKDDDLTTSVNNHIQDRTFYPNANEKYDLLTFFSNVKSSLINFLQTRLKSKGIKWYITTQVDLMKLKEQNKEVYNKPYFRSKTYAHLNVATFDEGDIDEAFHKLFESFEKYLRDGSGWILQKVVKLIVHTTTFKPISGSSYIELPKMFGDSILNIRNLDQKCFLWSCLASLHPNESFLVNDLEQYEKEINMQGINYPVQLKDLSKFERQNPQITINVFGLEDKEIIPLRITKQNDALHHINLLHVSTESKSHYCLIKNLNTFLRKANKSTHYLYYCTYCLHGFTKEDNLNDHVPYCKINCEQKVVLPNEKNCFIEFNDFEKTLRVPYVIYADFETINKPLDYSNTSASTVKTQLLEACSFGYKVVCSNTKYTKESVIYRGPDASKKLLEYLFREAYEIEQRLSNIIPMNLSLDEEHSFQQATHCCLCAKQFLELDQKARHHEHTTGKYIGATHMNCNLRCKQAKFIPIIFHGLKNFDAHLICQSMGNFKDKKISVIPETMEKYISFSIGSLRFIDSLAFLPSSLEKLVDNLSKKGESSFIHFNSEIKENADILRQKGIYPYEYMDSFQRFEETELPPKENFYSSIKNEHISDQDYKHAQKVFTLCKNLGIYHDYYLLCDVLLLADVFEEFRNMSQKCYDLDPCHFYTSPGLSWKAMLKMTGVTLELMTDIDQILFIEKGIRGGISQISNRYAKANNIYLNDYNPLQPTSFLAYYDVNNLYGKSLCQKLPTGFFRFLSEQEIESFDVHSLSEDSSKGYILECDLHYPENLHDVHNDYPLAPERKVITNDMLSPYAQKVLKELNHSEELPNRPEVTKLLTDLHDKHHYVLHYRNLKLYLELGLKLKKIHRIIEFHQEAFMKPYVEFNQKMRQQAASNFERDFFKLMNNSVFGKTMESVRKHRKVELINNEKRLLKVTAKSTYKGHRIFSENLAGVELYPNKVKLNKPIYIGMSVLDLSKHLMYDFYYNHLKKLYNEKIKLQMTDTDSFLFYCETSDIFIDMYNHSDLFDTSDFPSDHFLYSKLNHKVMGLMKSETQHHCIEEAVSLRSKMYTFKVNRKEEKRAKGISKVVVQKDLTLQNYKDVLFDSSQMTCQMHSLQSNNHIIHCQRVNKTGLSCFDDKRYLLDDGIKSLAYGHYSIKT